MGQVVEQLGSEYIRGRLCVEISRARRISWMRLARCVCWFSALLDSMMKTDMMPAYDAVG